MRKTQDPPTFDVRPAQVCVFGFERNPYGRIREAIIKKHMERPFDASDIQDYGPTDNEITTAVLAKLGTAK